MRRRGRGLAACGSVSGRGSLLSELGLLHLTATLMPRGVWVEAGGSVAGQGGAPADDQPDEDERLVEIGDRKTGGEVSCEACAKAPGQEGVFIGLIIFMF